MGSEVDALGTTDVELLDACKLKAERQLRSGHAKAYTSPKALRSFLNQQLPELAAKESCDHELLLVGSQTFEDQETCFVSTICGTCRHHFHFKSNGQSSHVRKLDKDHPQHMLIAYEAKGPAEVAAERSRNKFDDTYGVARFICCERECYFTIEIAAMLPKLTARDVGMFEDHDRVRDNLANARKDDPERYADVDKDYGAQPAGTMLKYLSDHLARNPEAGPLKIKKRNKRFMVSFSTDFDPLLRSLGWEEKDDAEGEACWFLPEPGPQRQPTPIKTLEARYEDAHAELLLLFPGSRTTPAWKLLLRVFQGDYTPFVSPASTLNQIQDADLNLLGCLLDYAPTVFSWAGILLSGIDPRRRDDFLTAAHRCILDRSEIARDAIVMYQSSFDEGSMNEVQLRDAFAFFGTTPFNGDDVNYFLGRYYSFLQQNPPDEVKAKAYYHLQIIENHTGQQILGNLQPEMWLDTNDTTAPTSGAKTQMSIKAAAELLQVEASYTAEMIRDFVNNLDETIDRAKVVEALEVLAELKRQQEQPSEAEGLELIASFIQDSGSMIVPRLGFAQPEPAAEPKASMDTPPGIRNIGNTCYLNSLLQYFYNVVPIRYLLKNFDDAKLELDEEHVASRKTGGNSLDLSLDEAIVARQFAEMLRDLFAQLEKTTDVAVQPSQKLANTALSSAAELLAKKEKPAQDIKPPPLPARPSPAPPTPASQDVEMVNVSVEPLDGKAGALSPSSSSQTLVDDFEPVSVVSAVDTEKAPDDVTQGNFPPSPAASEHLNEDTKMEDLPEDLTLQERTERIVQKLEQSDRSGTSQQDVEEIIGNILEHLIRSVKPTGAIPDMPGVQADAITNLFFSTMVHHTVDMKEEANAESDTAEVTRKEVMLDRWIHAFPHPEKTKAVPSSLYEALDRNLSYELLSKSRARYSTIRSLPPILHICIQRTEQSGNKNKNPVVIPEVLYMDRFMDAEADSDLWTIRRRIWAVQARISELESRANKDIDFLIKPAQNSYQFDPPPTTAESGEDWDPALPPPLDGNLLRDLAPITSKRRCSTSSAISLKRHRFTNSDSGGASFSYVDYLHEASDNIAEDTLTELSELKKEVEVAFEHMKKHKYAIHAIICHGGGMNAGHYWVWVRDYNKNTWVKYNDSVVTVDKRDSQTVLDELNRGGDPYYVAYVRDEEKENLIDVPQRTVPVDVVSSIDSGDGANDAALHVETIEGLDPNVSETDAVDNAVTNKGSDLPKQPQPQVYEVPESDEPPPYEII